MLETKIIKINLRKLVIFVICTLFVYLFFLGGIKHIRADYDNGFPNKRCPIENAKLGYIKNGNNDYEETFELEESKINTLSLPSQSTDGYYIYGDLINYYKIHVFVNGNEVHSVSVNTSIERPFWAPAYLINGYVFKLPELEKNKSNEILLIAGSKCKKYIVKLK